MLALLLILVCWGLIIHFGLKNEGSVGLIIVLCLFTALFVFVLCFIPVRFITIVDEYEIQFDSYSIESNKSFGSSGVLYYYQDEQLSKIGYDSIDVFVGDISGKIIIQETRFKSPYWFWIIAFIPDDMLIRTDVLIV